MKCRFALRVFVFFLNRTPQVRDMLEGWNKTLQFNLDGEAPFHVVVKDERAALGGGVAAAPDLVVTAPAPMFMGIITNQINADEAFMNKKYEVIGSPGDATRFRVLGERVQDYHPVVFGAMLKLAPLVTRQPERRRA